MEQPARTLPDDVVLEVLARLADVPALFRFATAAKRWRGIIADILRRRWPENSTHPAFLLGFFTQRQCYGSKEDEHPFPHEDVADCDSPPVFIPAPRSVLGPGFWSVLPSGLLDGAKPLTARRGLLLVRLAPVLAHSHVIRLAVCDLLAGTCDELPPLQCGRHWAPTSYAILTGQDCSSPDRRKKPRSPAPNCSTFFKVLAIGFVGNANRGDVVEYSLRTFSSAEPGWATPAKRFGEDRRCGGPDYCPNLQDDATVCGRGMTHWLCGNWWSESDSHDSSNYFTIGVSPEDGQVSSAKLPFLQVQPTPEVYQLAVVHGLLSLFLLYTGKECLWLDTWTRRDDGTHWHRARVIKLKPPEHRRIERVLYFWSGDKSGTLLIIDSNLYKYVVYLETGAMEEVSSQFRGMVGDAVPIEIDWPDLFMSRLAVERSH